MTPEEKKAKEIADKNGKLKLYWCGVELDGVHYDASPECYNSAMEMAAWKEQQMIEKAVDWLDKNANEYFPPSYGFQANTANLLVYYFKKAMEG